MQNGRITTLARESRAVRLGTKPGGSLRLLQPRGHPQLFITNAPLIGRGQSPSTSSSAPSHLKTLVHLLYPILVFKSGIGASSVNYSL